MQDEKIIELYFERDERAISETDEKYGPYCRKIAYNLLSDEFDSEECVNDTYMKAWNAIPPTKPSIFSAFLAKITRNLALDRLKCKGAKKRIDHTPASLDELSECIGGFDFSEELSASELGEIISRFLKTEQKSARIIFIRRYFFEDSIKDIARLLRFSEGNVKTTLHRTRARLAKFLSEEGVFV